MKFPLADWNLKKARPLLDLLLLSFYWADYAFKSNYDRVIRSVTSEDSLGTLWPVMVHSHVRVETTHTRGGRLCYCQWWCVAEISRKRGICNDYEFFLYIPLMWCPITDGYKLLKTRSHMQFHWLSYSCQTATWVADACVDLLKV